MKIIQALYLSLFILYSSAVLCQRKFYGVILDKDSKKEIPFATVINTTQNKGLYSTNNGRFELEVEEKDTISISCIGYERLTFIYHPDSEIDTFYLTHRIIELPNIIITSVNWSDLKEKRLGYADLKSKCHIGGTTGKEYVVYIPNTIKTRSYIYEANYNLSKWNSNPVAVRLHIYSVDKDKRPGIDLLDSNYIEILTEEISDRVINFDVSTAKIILPPEGVFVGIEWLGVYDNHTNSVLYKQALGPELGFNFKTHGQITYERVANGNWEASDVRKFFIGDTVEKELYKKNIPNASFGITIKIEKK